MAARRRGSLEGRGGADQRERELERKAQALKALEKRLEALQERLKGLEDRLKGQGRDRGRGAAPRWSPRRR